MRSGSMPPLLPTTLAEAFPSSHPDLTSPGQPGSMSRTHVRDEGLRRIGSLTAWVAAAAAAGTGFLAAAVYHATPGRATTTASSTSSNGTSAVPSGAAGPTGSQAGDPGFQAPVQAPVPLQQVPVVRSGAS